MSDICWRRGSPYAVSLVSLCILRESRKYSRREKSTPWSLFRFLDNRVQFWSTSLVDCRGTFCYWQIVKVFQRDDKCIDISFQCTPYCMINSENFSNVRHNFVPKVSSEVYSRWLAEKFTPTKGEKYSRQGISFLALRRTNYLRETRRREKKEIFL